MEMPSKLHFPCPSCGKINRIPADKVSKGPRCGHCHTALDTSGAPVRVNDDELQRLIDASPVPVLVDFFADWCAPCRSLGPTLAELGRQLAGRLVVAKVNTDSDPVTAGRLGVQSIPAVFLFRGGELAAHEVGARPLSYWQQWVRPHLAG